MVTKALPDIKETGNFEFLGKSQLLTVPYAMYEVCLFVLMEIAEALMEIKVTGNNMYSEPSGNVVGTSNPESSLHLNGGNGVFPNIESSGAKYLLFTKGPQTNPNNKLGWIGYAIDNKKMVFSEMPKVLK